MRWRPDTTWLLRGIQSPVSGSAWLQLRRIREEFSVYAWLGLRCELSALQDVRPAKLPTVMEPRDPLTFRGFHEEMSRVSGRAYVDAYVRERACKASVRELFVAESDGQPT